MGTLHFDWQLDVSDRTLRPLEVSPDRVPAESEQEIDELIERSQSDKTSVVVDLLRGGLELDCRLSPWRSLPQDQRIEWIHCSGS
ncbi:MAG TPA: hypothetical protein V6C91_20700, partial [Coleofasciculaceae cyanobacterium]